MRISTLLIPVILIAGPCRADNWRGTEMSCYDRGAKTVRHRLMWGTPHIFASPHQDLIGRWIKVRTRRSDGSQVEIIGVIAGTMGHVPPSRHSRYRVRELDYAFSGWDRVFPDRPHGVMDVEYSVMPKGWRPR